MKKIFAMILIVALAVSCFAGCGSTGTTLADVLPLCQTVCDPQAGGTGAAVDKYVGHKLSFSFT